MIVLDADSLMSAAAMFRLVRVMQANPRLGILQTLVRPAGQERFHSDFPIRHAARHAHPYRRDRLVAGAERTLLGP